MTQLEKVVKGLDSCRPGRNCGECPYQELRHQGDCNKQMEADALDLLKAQMPRVMTLDELYACDEGDCLYYQCEGEFDGNVLYIRSEVGFYVDLRAATHRFTCAPSLYGSLWRCWTSRPSAEMMASTPWEGDAE